MTQDLIDNPVPAAAGEPPVWERIGTDISRARTGPDAMKLAKLDWSVEQWPVQATDPQSWKTVAVEGHLANVRSDTRELLGVVGRGYRVFQNAQLFEFLGALVADRLVSFHAAGGLRGGRRVWALCRLPREYRPAPDDVVRPCLLVSNGHDGDGPLQMVPATVRDCCANAFNLPLDGGSGTGGGRGLTVRHHPGLGQGLAEARRNLQMIAARFERFGEEAAALAATPLSDRQVYDYFDALVPDADGGGERDARDRTLARLRSNFDGPGNTLPGVAGTAWAAFNAVGEWADGQRTFRGRDDLARDEGRLDSIWFGSSHRIKQAAYRSALELAGLN